MDDDLDHHRSDTISNDYFRYFLDKHLRKLTIFFHTPYIIHRTLPFRAL